MKRLALTLAMACMAYAALAQAPFTISRPADGSRVRETVKMLIPKNSVPPNGYIGIFIGGKFVEATVPPLDPSKKYYEYDLDTKAKGIPDGKLTLEAVLYVDYNSSSRIVDRTSVEVTVQNTAANKIPDNGLLLRYKWTPGTQTVYDLTVRRITDTGDEKLVKMGAKPSEDSTVDERLRMLYAVDNAYADGSGLVRMQAMPEKKKDSAFLKTVEDPAGRRFQDYEMHPIYERLSGTGLEIWGSIPFALPIEGTSAQEARTDLFADEPLPTLPAKRVKIGSSWPGRFQFGSINIDKLYTADSEVVHIPARGEFVDVEWEMGHPCAKIVNTIAVGEPGSRKPAVTLDPSKNASMNAFGGPGVELKETIWFALDRRQIVKIVRTVTQNEELASTTGYGTNPGGPPGAGAGMGPRMGGAASGGGAGAGAEVLPPPPNSELQKGRGAGMQLGGPMGSKLGGQGVPGFGRPGMGMGAGATPSTQFVRVTREYTFVLEQ
ncbi:MAG: hypothetical protein ACYC96_13400 [Fimbriimonadaceae bacterium]